MPYTVVRLINKHLRSKVEKFKLTLLVDQKLLRMELTYEKYSQDGKTGPTAGIKTIIVKKKLKQIYR